MEEENTAARLFWMGGKAFMPVPVQGNSESKHSYAYLVFTLVLSLLALTSLALEAALPLRRESREILQYGDDLVCALFFLDFLVMFCQAGDKKRYMLTWGWLDLASCIPMLDVLRWGRAARIVRIFRVLRGVKSARILGLFILERRSHSAFLAAALLTIMLITVCSISILHFEAPVSDSNIKTAEDAVWWAVVTITTVGYGDRYPVTAEGRVVAAILMIGGVGLFGLFAGFIATWFMAPTESKEESELAALRKEIAELKGLIAGKSSQHPD